MEALIDKDPLARNLWPVIAKELREFLIPHTDKFLISLPNESGSFDRNGWHIAVDYNLIWITRPQPLGYSRLVQIPISDPDCYQKVLEATPQLGD